MTLSLSHTHTNTHTYTHKHTHSQTLLLTLNLSLSSFSRQRARRACAELQVIIHLGRARYTVLDTPVRIWDPPPATRDCPGEQSETLLKWFVRLRGICIPLSGLHVLIAIQTPLNPFYYVRLDKLVWGGDLRAAHPSRQRWKNFWRSRRPQRRTTCRSG